MRSLIVLYFLGALLLSMIYFYGLENNVLYYTILFVIVSLMNAFSLTNINSKALRLALVLVPLGIYLLSIIIFPNNFVWFKKLIIIPMILSLFSITWGKQTSSET